MADGKRKSASGQKGTLNTQRLTAKQLIASAQSDAQKPTGRPSSYSEALAEEICDRIANGESLVQICRDEHMPNRRTVLRWMEADAAFATRSARAREVHADFAQDRMLEIEVGVLDGEIDATAARVVLSSMQWRASKLAPKKYGDTSKVEHSGPDGGAIKMESTVIDSRSMSPEDREALRQLMLKAQAKGQGE